MRVLLVNSNQHKSPLPVIPSGLCSVASAAEHAGHEVTVLDLCFSRAPARDLEGALAQVRPEVVGVSVRNLDNSAGYGTDFLLAATRKNVFEPLRAIFRGPIVVGGPPLGINGPEMLAYLGVELGIRGDGEHAFVELLRCRAAGASPSAVGGLVWRRDGELVADNPPSRVERLDELPPTRLTRYLDVRAYQRFASPIPVQTKRGCSLKCTYCTYNLIEGNGWRLRDPARVVDEIERLVAETGVRRVEFTDSVFNFPLEHAKAVLRAIVGRKLGVDLHTMGLNPAAVDDALVDLMVEAGFHAVDVGAESCCDVTLAGLGKSYRKDAIRRTAGLLHSRGLAVHWFLLVGAPGETPGTLRETLDTIDELADEWDLVDIGVGVRVYNGSPIATQMRAERAACSADAFFTPVAYEPVGVSVETLKQLTKEHALRRTNYFMYDEDGTIPPRTIQLAASVLDLLAPSQPVWRGFVAHRKLQRLLGILALRRLRFAWTSRPTA